MVRRVGIIGYGHLGQYLTSKILQEEGFELAFVWNRTRNAIKDLDASLILEKLDDFSSTDVDIIVEVAHPFISKQYGEAILKHCDYMMGSPTALCDESLLKSLKNAATKHTLYVPSGALWGGQDIQKLSEAGLLQYLAVTMKMHPHSLKLSGYLKTKNDAVKSEAVVLYKGCVRDICDLAPNNSNTMAAACLAASNLGFDGVIGCLVSDPNLTNYHIVEIEAFGFPKTDGSYFYVHTIRRNPAEVGKVTGEATYAAYYGSLKRAFGKGPGLHLC